MKTKLLALSMALGLSATGAMAADAIIYEPAPVSPPLHAPFDWTGFYLGAQGGYAWTTLENGFLALDEDFDGGFLGVHAGYNVQNGDWVYGIEGDINYNWAEETFGGVDVGLDWDASLRGRLGYAWDRTLLYGTAGLALANGYVEGGGYDESDTFVGWTVGAGVEHAFTQNVSARIEYRYSDFGDNDFGLGLGDFELTQHKVGLGFSYRF
mgnify:CR=1 FL=1